MLKKTRDSIYSLLLLFIVIICSLKSYSQELRSNKTHDTAITKKIYAQHGIDLDSCVKLKEITIYNSKYYFVDNSGIVSQINEYINGDLPHALSRDMPLVLLDSIAILDYFGYTSQSGDDELLENVLPYAIGLKGLELSTGGKYGYTELRDLSFLRSLNNLERLAFSSTDKIDLNTLPRLDRLRILTVDASPNITSFGWLKNLPSLDTLTIIRANKKASTGKVIPRFSCSHLKRFEVRNSSLNNINSLSACPELKEVIVDGNEIKDTKGIATLSQIRILTLSENKIVDPRPLLTLKKVSLLLCKNPINKKLLTKKEMLQLNLDGCY